MPLSEDEKPVPPMIKIEEFLALIKGKYHVESIGGFASWMKKTGMPRKLSFIRWGEKFNEYLKRRV